MKDIAVQVVAKECMAGEGILSLLYRYTDFQVSDVLKTPEILAKDITLDPARIFVVVMIHVNDDFDAFLKTWKAQCRDIALLVVSADNRPWQITNLMQAGISGYVLMDDGIHELQQAIISIAAGESYFSPKVSAGLIKGLVIRNGLMRKAADDDDRQALTLREIEIVRLLSGGHSSSGIADKLHISPLTVNTHRKRILRKLQLTNTPSLVNYALRNGLA